ncbi:MAG TPA: D-serine ammonia-lyase [Clostridia bacterium]|nr:D-serine ammonia-lyase [Clostridia bacterium]
MPAVADAIQLKETFWENEKLQDAKEALLKMPLSSRDVEDAALRLDKFAPLIMRLFPETASMKGQIESPLVEIKSFKRNYGNNVPGRFFIKQDSELQVAGSVKARGGIYEVLKHTEDLALSAGLIDKGDDYAKLASTRCREFFSRHTIQVGSTGNLGLSIGISAAALGYRTIIHMSADAKQWKKDLLRKKGAEVREYQTDYLEAVKQGREDSAKSKNSYFIDDENSRDLFLGYAVAAKRLKAQLEEKGIYTDAEHPLFVYIPCGVGGAPGGITFGLKTVFGNDVHCFFTEPVRSCCMLIGMATGLHSRVSVQDFGIDGKTFADGLAVSRPSGFVGKLMEPLLSGIFTISDERLDSILRNVYASEGIYMEPSACAAFAPVVCGRDPLNRYIEKHVPCQKDGINHVFWATGGSLVPEYLRRELLGQAYKELGQ